VEVTARTRREKRALRLQKLVSNRQARQAARLAHLDYRVSGDGGALKAHTHSLAWHRAKNQNGPAPPPGRGWDRSGPTYVVGVHELGFPKLVIHHQWRRLIAEK
jgi:hypothetical protein